MNPTITDILDGEVLTFTMRTTNVSFANAIRRTIVADIPSVVIKTELYEQNQCKIEINTTRFHNEIVKHRLSCIPVHMDFTDLEILPGNYTLELDVQNDTDHVLYVTTEDFKIRSKATGNLLTAAETRKIFPPCEKTNSYIDFLRLRPKLTETIPGEQIKLTADFSLGSPRDNSVFTVVSKCTYSNTVDPEAAKIAWDAHEKKMKSDGVPETEVAFHKKNFYILDAQRHFVPDSFDFAIQSVGVFQNKAIVQKACEILRQKLKTRIEELDTGIIQVTPSKTTIEGYDIIIPDEDYTIGKVIEFMLYERYFRGAGAGEGKMMTFCGFKKYHPHDTHSVIRVAYQTPVSADVVRGHFRTVATDAQDIFGNVAKYFEERG